MNLKGVNYMCAQSITQQSIKKFNTNSILRVLESNDSISRTEIAKHTNLNKATVSTIVKELIAKGLVNDLGYGKSSGGKKPRLIELYSTAKYIIVIIIEANIIEASILNLKLEILDTEKQNTKCTNKESILKIITRLIAKLKINYSLKDTDLLQIGLTIPGIVNKNGYIVDAPNLNWKDYNLIEELTKLHPEYTYRIINEANAGAIGINHQYPDVKNLIYLSVSQGVGTGIIINGELYKGEYGYSGEFGHTIIKENGKKCRCGQNGCFEQYVSEQAVYEILEEKGIHLKEKTFNALNYLDSDITSEIYIKLSKFLNLGVLNIARIFDPELIILGNHIANLKDNLDINNKVINSNVKFNEESQASRKTGIASIIRDKYLYE